MCSPFLVRNLKSLGKDSLEFVEKLNQSSNERRQLLLANATISRLALMNKQLDLAGRIEVTQEKLNKLTSAIIALTLAVVLLG